MDRRSSLKAMLLITAGTVVIPSCVRNGKSPAVSYTNLDISADDELLVGDMSETYIPKTDTPGAKDVNAHLFALMMVDDCFSPENQQKFMDGMKSFREYSDNILDKSFGEASSQSRTEFLTSLENKKEVPENVSYFFKTVKRYTLQGYTTSQYFLTNVEEYKLVPGKYYGCVPLNKTA